jgi:thioredoxin reductase (NADPH)
MHTRKIFDVVIIGAGPAGLSSAIYTGRAKLNTLVLEKSMPGGQILMTDWVENYPGFPEGVAPFPLMEDFYYSHRIKSPEIRSAG